MLSDGAGQQDLFVGSGPDDWLPDFNYGLDAFKIVSYDDTAILITIYYGARRRSSAICSAEICLLWILLFPQSHSLSWGSRSHNPLYFLR